jgi:hypothetical protein
MDGRGCVPGARGGSSSPFRNSVPRRTGGHSRTPKDRRFRGTHHVAEGGANIDCVADLAVEVVTRKRQDHVADGKRPLAVGDDEDGVGMLEGEIVRFGKLPNNSGYGVTPNI